MAGVTYVGIMGIMTSPKNTHPNCCLHNYHTRPLNFYVQANIIIIRGLFHFKCLVAVAIVYEHILGAK